MILFANTKDNFHTSIEFAPIMQFQGLEIYFLINRCTNQSLKSSFFYLTIQAYSQALLFRNPNGQTQLLTSNTCITSCMTDSFLLLTWHIENASIIPVQAGVNLRLKCLHLPHSTVLFVHLSFLSPLVKSPKKIPHSFLCMHVYSKTVFQIACFVLFCFLVERKLDCFWP